MFQNPFAELVFLLDLQKQQWQDDQSVPTNDRINKQHTNRLAFIRRLWKRRNPMLSNPMTPIPCC